MLDWTTCKLQLYEKLLGFDKTLTPGQLTPYWPPYWPPIKSMGKWKWKNPELSMGLDVSSSINLAYLKLPRWQLRCRFSTPFSFDWRICHGKSSTEQVWISASMTFVPARKLSNKNSEEILANNTHVTNRERSAHDYINGKFVVPGPSLSAHINYVVHTVSGYCFPSNVYFLFWPHAPRRK